ALLLGLGALSAAAVPAVVHAFVAATLGGFGGARARRIAAGSHIGVGTVAEGAGACLPFPARQGGVRVRVVVVFHAGHIAHGSAGIVVHIGPPHSRSSHSMRRRG